MANVAYRCCCPICCRFMRCFKPTLPPKGSPLSHACCVAYDSPNRTTELAAKQVTLQSLRRVLSLHQLAWIFARIHYSLLLTLLDSSCVRRPLISHKYQTGLIQVLTAFLEIENVGARRNSGIIMTGSTTAGCTTRVLLSPPATVTETTVVDFAMCNSMISANQDIPRHLA